MGSFMPRAMPITGLAIVSLSAAPALGGLVASQCVVIYNSASTESADIARYYAQARAIEPDHLLGIALPRVETMVRGTYDEVVKPAVREFLRNAEWGDAIRCLVTCYGVPLRIAQLRPTPTELELVDALNTRLTAALDNIRALIDEIQAADRDAPPPPQTATNAPPTYTVPNDADSIELLYRRYADAMTTLAARHDGLTGHALIEARTQTFHFVTRATGEEGILDHAPADAHATDPSFAVRIRMLRERLRQQLRRIESQTAYGSTPKAFEEALPSVRDTRGLFGVAAALRRRIRAFDGENSAAAFDSELALVLRDDYVPAGWQVNDLNDTRPRPKGGPPAAERSPRTLMVSRLDGPSPDIVRRMIDDAIRVERTGLRGTFYIDARGVTDSGLARYDRDLFDLAHIVRTRTEMPVVLDIHPDVFQPGQCTDAALYCGWYSLGRYVDAFDFVPGAVAIHIASFELVSLRNPDKSGWCPELLKDGVAATFGATSEPYLQSFPLPTEFFCRLLTGKYTLVEAYSRTKYYNSWQLTLLGDPLYNPFKTNPQLGEDWETRSPADDDTPTKDTR